MEYFVATGVGTGVAAGAERAISGLWTWVTTPSSSKENKKFYPPEFFLLELAKLTLQSDLETFQVRLHFGTHFITPRSYTITNRLHRTCMTYFTKDTQSRERIAGLIDVFVRCVRWYDPNEDSPRGYAIKSIFEKSIKGLEICKKPYEDIGAIPVINNFDRCISLLRHSLAGHDYSEEEQSLIEAQNHEMELIDSTRRIWVREVTRDGEKKQIDLLVDAAARLQIIEEIKNEYDTSHSEDIKLDFENHMKGYETLMDGQKGKYLKAYNKYF